MDNCILLPKLLDILAAIPDSEGNPNIDDLDIDSDNGDDVEFDNHIDMIISMMSGIYRPKTHGPIM